jgi:C-terminal processing protease CtpA/Prc
VFAFSSPAQTPDGQQKKSGRITRLYRDDALAMLSEIKNLLEEHYFDRSFNGVDLDKNVRAAKERVKILDYNWQMFRVIAQLLIDLDDSHTRLILPPTKDLLDYGVRLQMIGNDCYIVYVRPGSDAEKKGLRAGDVVEAIGSFRPTRRDLWKMLFVMNKLDPSATVNLTVRDLSGKSRQIRIVGTTFKGSSRRREMERIERKLKEKPYKCERLSQDLVACKLRTFSTEKSVIDEMFKEIREYPKLILDLRGNSGGYVDTEERVVGSLFDHDVKIGDLVTRKKTEERMAESRGERSFKGELLVLIDSLSASAAEVTARVIQIEKRGRIVGDYSSGAVMTSIGVRLVNRGGTNYGYAAMKGLGISVTIGDLVMSDGGRLEKVGVKPDLPVVPSGTALSMKTDPVLAYAANVFGVNLSPESAGALEFLIRSDLEDELEDNQ